MIKEKDVTRRQFLQAAAVVGATSSLGTMVAPHIMYAQAVTNPVRYGFIGTGTEGCTLLKFLATIPEGRCIATTLTLDDGSHYVVYEPSLAVYELREAFGDAIEEEHYKEISKRGPERTKQ